MEKLEINHVSFTYPKEEREALRDICMTVRPGSFVVLCGKSGCGKSTLLRSIKPTVRPHGQRSGSILIDGREAETLSQREMAEGIGFVMQDPASQTVCDKVWHELAFGPESIGMKTEEIRARVAEMASFFGIQNWFYQDVAALSGGQLQLLNLAAVMVMHPTLLLLDEPTAQLDPIAAHEFFVALEKIHHELGTTIILSEHRLEEALPMADHVVVMEDGGVFTQGTPREAAKALYAANHEMLGAFPLPMRLYAMCSEDSDTAMPITVAEGRSWLMQKDLRPLPIYQEMDEPHTPICLSAENLWMRYAKELPDVLKGLSFRLHEGEWYSIVGGNGSGKTTALSMVLSAHRPHRGRIQRDSNMKVAAVPQDPRDLFAHKTVLEELTDVVGESGTKQEREERINAVVSSCELQGLLDRHPYDLSGGEQQRVALAMALSQRPRILLLDEPTKGLDAPFKNRLGRMLKRIQAQGVSIFMVSHDIEFCAAYADRCGMFFDGQIVSEGAPRRFFRDKTFYTTAAARMSRGILPQAVLEEDVAYALDLHEEEREESIENQKSEYPKSDGDSALTPQKKSRSVQTVIMGWIFAAAAVFTQLTMVRRYDDGRELLWQIAGIALAAAACGCLIPKKRFEILPRQKKKKLRRGTRLALWGVWLCMLMTVWVGMVILHDKKYYFISTLLVLEALAAFILALEGRRLSAREIVLISVFCALTVAGRVAFAALPQFKPMVALVILAGICFGGETGFFVGAVSAFVSNFYFVQGPWTPWQMLAMGAVGLAGGLCFEIGHITKTKAGLCAFGFGITLILYGGIMNLASAVLLNDTWSLSQLLTVYAMGFPFDVVHGISTVFFLWFGAEPMIEKVRRVIVKYGIGE